MLPKIEQFDDEALREALAFSEALTNLDDRTAMRIVRTLAGLDPNVFMKLLDAVKDKKMGIDVNSKVITNRFGTK